MTSKRLTSAKEWRDMWQVPHESSGWERIAVIIDAAQREARRAGFEEAREKAAQVCFGECYCFRGGGPAETHGDRSGVHNGNVCVAADKIRNLKPNDEEG